MCKRRDCLNNYCTKYYTSHKYLTDRFLLTQLTKPFHAYLCCGRPSVQDYILRRAFTASTSASSSIVVIYDLGLGPVYDWFMNMHDASRTQCESTLTRQCANIQSTV